MTFVALENDYDVVDERQEDAVRDVRYQVSGGGVPTVKIELDAGQGIVCQLPQIMQMSQHVSVQPWPGLKGRLHLLSNRNLVGSASVELSTGRSGNLGVFDLPDHGGRLLCPQGALLAAGPGVMVSVYAKHRDKGCDALDVLQLEGRGTAFLRANGEVDTFKLLAGQQTVVNLSAVAAMRATIDLDPLDASDDSGFARFACLTGPGLVWMQSGMTHA